MLGTGSPAVSCTGHDSLAVGGTAAINSTGTDVQTNGNASFSASSVYVGHRAHVRLLGFEHHSVCRRHRPASRQRIPTSGLPTPVTEPIPDTVTAGSTYNGLSVFGGQQSPGRRTRDLPERGVDQLRHDHPKRDLRLPERPQPVRERRADRKRRKHGLGALLHLPGSVSVHGNGNFLLSPLSSTTAGAAGVTIWMDQGDTSSLSLGGNGAANGHQRDGLCPVGLGRSRWERNARPGIARRRQRELQRRRERRCHQDQLRGLLGDDSSQNIRGRLAQLIERRRQAAHAHPEAGDTLVEILISLVVIGITVTAILGAFVTTISASAEQRNLAGADAFMRSFVDTATYDISLSSSPVFVACPSSVPAAYSQIATAWNASSSTYSVAITGISAPPSGCSAANPSPQQLSATVSAKGISMRCHHLRGLPSLRHDRSHRDLGDEPEPNLRAGGRRHHRDDFGERIHGGDIGEVRFDGGEFLFRGQQHDDHCGVARGHGYRRRHGHDTAGTSPTNPLDQFTYAPTVTGVAPSSGNTAGGTTVTLTGTGFIGASGVNFGATAATSYTVVEHVIDHRRFACRFGRNRRHHRHDDRRTSATSTRGQVHVRDDRLGNLSELGSRLGRDGRESARQRVHRCHVGHVRIDSRDDVHREL